MIRFIKIFRNELGSVVSMILIPPPYGYQGNMYDYASEIDIND